MPQPSVPKRTLIVCVKAPVPGEVKTRLIPQLTASEAAELYRCFVVDIIQKMSHSSLSACLQVAYQPHGKAPDLGWLPMKTPPPFFRQDGRSLGERLTHAFGHAFGRGAQQVVIIGCDSPTLPSAYVEQAFVALQDGDVVLGPAPDGGYYLIGLSRPCLKLFDDVTWSSDHVFERTARNAQSLKYTLKALPPHHGIETVDDLSALRAEIAQNPTIAPHTRRFFDTLVKLRTLPTAR